MKQSSDDISDLAENIGSQNLYEGKVNLEKIAKRENIRFVEGNYGNYFLGQLVHLSNRFYIVLNSDLLATCEQGRLRFTIAHELGHYFINWHRTKLSQGVSLSFGGELTGQECNQIEKEANFFAANLLMPKTQFVTLAKKLEGGLPAILTLKSRYDTSIESTSIHYINQNLSPSIMIKWNSDFTKVYGSYSESFSHLTKITGNTPIRLDKHYLRTQMETIEINNFDYIESATPLSRWFSTVTPGTSRDILGLEQTVKLGEFGGITILTFHK
jgi:Zn-dependent peptidase ImmA (M78 family)